MNRRGALSLGEMTMFATYLLIGTVILAAAVNIYQDVYPLSMEAKLKAGCNSLVDVLDTAYSTGHTKVDISKEVQLLGDQGIDIKKGGGAREIVALAKSDRKRNVTCYTHAAPKIGLISDIEAEVRP